jgi:hypothetical protein
MIDTVLSGCDYYVCELESKTTPARDRTRRVVVKYDQLGQKRLPAHNRQRLRTSDARPA